MRAQQLVLLALLLGTLPGCLWNDERTPSAHTGLRTPFSLQGKDIVVMDVALLEAPLGDRYINSSLWQLADEQIIPLQKKSILEQNGFRIGLVGNSPPSELLMLLTSPRSCANPRRIRFHTNREDVPPLVLGPKQESVKFELRKGKEKEVIQLVQAELQLKIEAEFTEDGRTKIRFVPQIKHGEINLELWKPRPDRSGWMLEPNRPTKAWASLAWEVTLAPGAYLVIGGRYDRPGTLGHASFVRREESVPVQRLLVLRTSRPAQTHSKDTTNDGQHRAPTIAEQATRSTVR